MTLKEMRNGSRAGLTLHPTMVLLEFVDDLREQAWQEGLRGELRVEGVLQDVADELKTLAKEADDVLLRLEEENERLYDQIRAWKNGHTYDEWEADEKDEQEATAAFREKLGV